MAPAAFTDTPPTVPISPKPKKPPLLLLLFWKANAAVEKANTHASAATPTRARNANGNAMIQLSKTLALPQTNCEFPDQPSIAGRGESTMENLASNDTRTVSPAQIQPNCSERQNQANRGPN